MALVTQGQKFSCRLSLYVFAPGRETVSSCFLLSPPKPCHPSPNADLAPAASSPSSSPPSVKTVRRASSKLFPSLLLVLQLSTKNTVLFSCSRDRKNTGEMSSTDTLDWQSVLTSYSQTLWSLLYFCFQHL